MIFEYGTRNHRDLQIPKVRLEFGKRRFANKSHSLVSKKISKVPSESARPKDNHEVEQLFHSIYLPVSVTVTMYCF